MTPEDRKILVRTEYSNLTVLVQYFILYVLLMIMNACKAMMHDGVFAVLVRVH